MVRMTPNQNLCVTVRLYLDILSTYHSTLQLFAKYRKAALTRFHRGLTKCQVEVSCNTDRVNVFNLNTLTWVAAIHPMWSKCPHGVSRNAEGYSGEWRFVSFTTSTGHFDQLILGAPFSPHGFPAPFRRRFPALPCGVIAVYLMQTVFRFSMCGAGSGNKKIATQQPESDHLLRDGLGSGLLCSDKKVKNLLRLLREPSWNSKINMLY